MPKFNTFIEESKTVSQIVAEATKGIKWDKSTGKSVSDISKEVGMTRMGTYKLISSSLETMIIQIRKDNPKLDNYESFLILFDVIREAFGNEGLEITDLLAHLKKERQDAIKKDATNHLGK